MYVNEYVVIVLVFESLFEVYSLSCFILRSLASKACKGISFPSEDMNI